MIDAKNFSVEETLRNGLLVTIRAIRSEDGALLLQGVSELEKQSLYLRFFKVKNEISDEELKYFTDVDFKDHVALVVTTETDKGARIIGGGRYFAYNDSAGIRKAEVAFMVHDQYQGNGIATAVIKHLLAIARRNGIAQFEAEVLTENSKMLAVFSRTGLPMNRAHMGGVIHVTLDLA